DDEHELARARRRLAFDELFLIQLGMLTRRANWRAGPAAPRLAVPRSLIFEVDVTEAGADGPAAAAEVARAGGTLWGIAATSFDATLAFRLTGAQRRVMREVLSDLVKAEPMSRLLQGDVGSGKTVVAAAALLAAAVNGYQGALLAPTEILAEQHYRGVS